MERLSRGWTAAWILSIATWAAIAGLILLLTGCLETVGRMADVGLAVRYGLPQLVEAGTVPANVCDLSVTELLRTVDGGLIVDVLDGCAKQAGLLESPLHGAPAEAPAEAPVELIEGGAL